MRKERAGRTLQATGWRQAGQLRRELGDMLGRHAGRAGAACVCGEACVERQSCRNGLLARAREGFCVGQDGAGQQAGLSGLGRP